MLGGFLVLIKNYFMNKNQELGKRGELIAKNHYFNLGYKLLAENWRHGRSEIDLIFNKNKDIVFIEVKSRNFNTFDFKTVPLTKKQVITLKTAILAYCYLHKISLENTRLDLILVVFKQKNKRIIIKKYYNILN